MRINNNIMAMNTHRQLGANQTNGAKSLEKLSSGLRINRAGDDAAGLAISEKMRGQIRGLTQASRNAQDGISLIQTAEGALNESHSILQRMRELAVQSATDTNTAEDRAEIQREVDQLTSELTRIADNTDFNTQKLLSGDFSAKFHIGANEGQNMDVAIADMRAEALGVASAEGFALEMTVQVTGHADTEHGDLAIAGATSSTVTADYDVVKLDSTTTVGSLEANYALTNSSGEYVAYSNDGKSYTMLTASQATLGTGTLVTAGAVGAGDFNAIDFGDPVVSGSVTISVTADGDDKITGFSATATANIQFEEGGELASGVYTVVGTGHHLVGGGDSHGLVDSKGNVVGLSTDGLTFRSFSDATQNLFVIKEDSGPGTNALQVGSSISVTGDGGIDVSSQSAANSAITVIDEAIVKVSTARSEMGAVQNRLEHTINNLGTSAENLAAAESRIRDVDMAAEMMEFTKTNILSQAATAMLAQANMAPQSVLQLLG